MVAFHLDFEIVEEIFYNRPRPSQIVAAKKIAKGRDIPYQALMRSWINEAIKRERI